MLLFGFLLGLHGCIILGHVENVYMLPAANGLQQAEEGSRGIPSKESVEAIKHHSSVAVTQLQPETAKTVTTASYNLICSVYAFTGAAKGSADLLGPNASTMPFCLLNPRCYHKIKEKNKNV